MDSPHETDVPYPDEEFVPSRGKRLKYVDEPAKPVKTATLPNGETVELADHEEWDDHA